MQDWKQVLIEHSKQGYILKIYSCEDYAKNSVLFRIISSLKPNKRVLSLGCGGGREVKALINAGHEVTAVDISREMIGLSKKIAPKARYFLKEASEFKIKEKFDYILGLDNLLCYLPEKNRIKLIENSIAMLNKDGKAIFSVINLFGNYRTFLKSIIGLFKLKRFGDVVCKHKDPNKPPCIMHYFTFNELNKFLKSFGHKYNIQKDNRLLVVEMYGG